MEKYFWRVMLAILFSCMLLSESRVPVWAAETEVKNKNTQQWTDSEAEMQILDEKPDLPENTEGLTNIYEDGEGIFLAAMPDVKQKARSAVSANLVVGTAIPYPTNLGNYSTNYFTVNGRVAYCLESAKATPPVSDYVANEFENNELLQKVLYYGYGGPGDVTDIYMPAFDTQLKYLFTHLAAAYAYCGIDGFTGCTMQDIEDCGVWGYISYIDNLPSPTSPWLGVTPVRPDTYIEGDRQRTPEFQMRGDERCSITIDIPAGVTCHYKGTEITDSVKLSGGDRFYFSAPWDMTAYTWTPELVIKKWKAMVLSTGNGNQDVGYGSFFEEQASGIWMIVDWRDYVKIRVFKRDEKFSSIPLQDALFAIYTDEDCTNLIAEMPLTDEKGITDVIVRKQQDKVYIKELQAPAGYRRNQNVYELVLGKLKNRTVTYTNQEQMGKITVQKQGGALTGVEGKEGALRFLYDPSAYSGARYTISAVEDIYSQDRVTKYHNAGDIVAELETGADGSAVSQELYLGKYRVEEVKAPYGLVYGTTEEQRIKGIELPYAGQEAEFAESTVLFTNDRPEISVKAVKRSKNSGITLEGAVFGLYAEEDITALDGTVLVTGGTLIEQATSDADGNADFQSDLPMGFQYGVRELQAPENYYQLDEAFLFTYEYQDDRTYTYTFEQEFYNEEVHGEIHIEKTDKDSQAFVPQGDAQLAGAGYGLYAAADIAAPDGKSGLVYNEGDLVTQGKISGEGTLDFTDLYLGEYIVKEMEAPEGYLLDETEYPVSLEYEGQDVKKVQRNVTVKERVKRQAFQILKISEDGEQTEANLVEGAGFQIYLISNLLGVRDGSLKPGNGSAFLSEDFVDYDFSREETASYYEDGKKINVPELFTDRNGYMKSPEIPYGDYVVIESSVPDNLHPVKPFIVHILEDSREPQAWRVFDDRPFQFLLKIVKKDAQTQTEVVDNSASYQIYDVNAEEYVEMPVRYPSQGKTSVFHTSEDGFLVTPGFLKSGTYRIEEVQAPEDYVQQGFEESLLSDGRNVPLNEVTQGGGYQEESVEPILVSVDSGTAHQVEEETGVFTVLVEQSNNEAVGSLTLHKKGEKLMKAVNVQDGLLNRLRNGAASVVNQLSGFITGKDILEESAGYSFTYEESGLEGVEFSVYAKDTIYTPDGQTDSDGNRIVRYKEDALVASLVTDADGTVVLNNLPIGNYYVTEEKTEENHVLDRKVKEFSIAYNGQEKAVDYVELDLTNERQRVVLEIIKKDSITDAPIKDVTFGLYAGEDILDAGGQIAVEKDVLIETGKTNEEGKLVFQSNLPHGKYYAKELKKKAGYLDSGEVYEFEAYYTKPEETVLQLSCEVKNDPIVMEFTKLDVADGQEIEGARLQIRKDGKVVEEWISEKEPHPVYALEPGTYQLHEVSAANGYMIAEDVEFTVKETGEIQKVEMQDARVMGQLKIRKTDSESGEALEGVEFTLYEKESGKEIATLITDREGHAESELLPIGWYESGVFKEEIAYVLKETKVKDGYQEPEEEWEFVFEYQDDRTPVIEVLKEIQNTKESDVEAPVEKDTPEQKKTEEIKEHDTETGGATPKTGDSAKWLLPLLGILISGGSMIGMVVWIRGRKRKR